MAYNHAFEIAFSLTSPVEDSTQVPPDQLRAALLKRIEQIDTDNEWFEAVGPAFDTYETEASDA